MKYNFHFTNSTPKTEEKLNLFQSQVINIKTLVGIYIKYRQALQATTLTSLI